jgi:FtsP/CotA-like multicopper oxidase with cupredoxin domain
MRFHSLFCLAAGIGAIATPTPQRLPRFYRDKDSCNTADDRARWCDGFSIDTDYYNEAPNTGVVRRFHWEVENVVVAPDGISRNAITINGQLPGPTIYADWGDTVVVHVKNRLTTFQNGTSIHFHGVRQLYTNQNDGVGSITQCPTPPGSEITYTWRATQYGSSWYHSHFGLQTWEGVYGGIIVNGPATANYEEDKGVLFLADWTHETVDGLWDYAQTAQPTLDTGLINGTNVYNNSGVLTGYYFNTSFVSGTSYRIRLVNSAIDSFFKFSIDNHTFTVIENDWVPIEPYTTDVISIGIGEYSNPRGDFN